MTQHLHSEFIEDCWRCDLSRDELLPDEAAAFTALVDTPLDDEDHGDAFAFVD